MSRRLVRELEKEYEVEDRSALAMTAVDCLQIEEQCKLVADIIREIPDKFWGTDEGSNRYIVIGQCPRTSGRVTNFTSLFPNCSLLLAHLIQLVQPEPSPTPPFQSVQALENPLIGMPETPMLRLPS